MNAADKDLVTARAGWFEAALKAAWLCSREDRRLLAMPKMRDAIVEVAAMRAIGSKTASVSKGFFEGIARDAATFEAYEGGANRYIRRGLQCTAGLPMIRPRDYAAFVLIYCLGLPFGAAGIVALAYEIGFIVGQVTS